LSWKEDRDFVIARILAVGNWESLRWLLQRVSKAELREWLHQRKGGGLSARQLRFWETTLGISHRIVSGWIASPARQCWEGR
jgi:hypothetical protein